MSTIERRPIAIQIGTTFRYACRPGHKVNGTNTPYTSDEVRVRFRLRSSNKTFDTRFDMTQDIDGWWNITVSDKTTEHFTHQSMYYTVDVEFISSGDVDRFTQGPVNVIQIGGRP